MVRCGFIVFQGVLMFTRIFAVAAFLLAGWIVVAAPAQAGTLSGSFYADPNSAVKRWLAANPNDSRAPLIASRIGSQPQGKVVRHLQPEHHPGRGLGLRHLGQRRQPDPA